MNARLSRIGAAAAVAAFPMVAAAADTSAVSDKFRWLTFLVFGLIIGLTMYVTYLAAKRVKSASQFYAAGRSVSGIQNGWAIAGDYLSAASFLGIAGLISLYGYDGFMYSVGWLVAYITVLLVIAEPCRNIGKYTLGDILAFRFTQSPGQIFGSLTGVGLSVNFAPQAPGAVPEPATWAMMIIGFGAIGGALRRRQAVRVRYA